MRKGRKGKRKETPPRPSLKKVRRTRTFLDKEDEDEDSILPRISNQNGVIFLSSATSQQNNGKNNNNIDQTTSNKKTNPVFLGHYQTLSRPSEDTFSRSTLQ